jgi:two-component system LytT family response regulator
MIDLDSILYITADGNYSIILTTSKKIISSKSLIHFEKRLPNTIFIRIHDAHIININKTLKYVKGIGGYIVMENQMHLDVSVRRKKNLMQFLNK